MSSDHHLDEVIAIYALGGLQGEERRGVEAHLRECSRCRGLLQEARGIVNLLPLSVEEVKPAPATKTKLFARIDEDLALTAQSAPMRGTENRIGRRPIIFARPFALALLGVAALIILAILAIPYIGQFRHEQDIAAILNNPNARTRLVGGTKDAPTAQGKLVAVPGEPNAVLIVTGLKPLPPDKTFEFWLIRGTQPVPAGLFDVNQDGSMRLLVIAAQSIDSYDKLGVTIEQRAGEQTPKGTLVLEYGF